jgi:hypothetical protein
MNDDLTGLEQMLQRATAPTDAPQDDLDADSKSLREAWLAFGQLLDAAQPPDSAPRCDSVPPCDSVPLLRRSSAGRKYGLVAAALAASLLVAGSVYWSWGGRVAPSAAIAKANNVAVVQGAKVNKLTAGPFPAASPANDLRWDDTLDQQIADAGNDVALAQSDLAHAFDTTDLVRYRLQQAQQDIEKNKL